MSLLYPGVDDEDAMQWYQELHSGIPEAPPPPPPPHPSESWGRAWGKILGSEGVKPLSGGLASDTSWHMNQPARWDVDNDGFYTKVDADRIRELEMSPWIMETYDPSYMTWQPGYGEKHKYGKPYDPTLYNLDDQSPEGRNAAIQYMIDKAVVREDRYKGSTFTDPYMSIYAQPDMMTENLYSGLLGGAVEDGMWSQIPASDMIKLGDGYGLTQDEIIALDRGQDQSVYDIPSGGFPSGMSPGDLSNWNV
jgi:hypothetical protein